MKRLAIVFTSVVLLGIGMLVGLQRQMIFPRHLVEAPDKPRRLPPDAERLWLETPEGRVEAWYARGDERSADTPGPAVIFAHGNGEIIDHWPQLLEWYAARGVSALLVEYRGYGRSDGEPSAQKIGDDMLGFYEMLVDRPEVDADRLIFHGRSLGGGAVCLLARQAEPAALILQSTFTSLAELARHHFYVPSFLLRDEFDNLSYVGAASLPVLITHGSEDSVVPVEHARRLHDAAPNSVYVEIEGRGHNDAPMPWDSIASFLRSNKLLPPASSPRNHLSE